MDKFACGARALALALVCALAALAPGSVAQAGRANVARHIEGLERVALMTVDARIVIEADGTVSQAHVDTKIVPALAASLERNLLQWRFEPVLVAGKALRVNTRMRVALAAEQQGESYRVWVDGVDYPDDDTVAAVLPDGELEPIRAGRMYKPGYPLDQQMRGVMGRVMLAIRVTPEGTTGDVTVVQSLLYDFGRPLPLSRRALADFEAEAVRASRKWTYKVPPGPARKLEDMTVTVPVIFIMGDYDLDAPGQWLVVQRIPRQTIPWLPASQTRAGLGLASSGGGSVSQFGAGPKLIQDGSGMTLQ